MSIRTDDGLLRVVRKQNKELGIGVNVVNWKVADDHQSFTVETLENVNRSWCPTGDFNGQLGHGNMIGQVGHAPVGICHIVGKVAVVPVVQEPLKTSDRQAA